MTEKRKDGALDASKDSTVDCVKDSSTGVPLNLIDSVLLGVQEGSDDVSICSSNDSSRDDLMLRWGCWD